MLKIKYGMKQTAEHLRRAFSVVIPIIAMELLWFSYVTSLPSSESWMVELTLILLSINNIVLLMFISFLVIVPGFEEENSFFYLKSYSKQGFYRGCWNGQTFLEVCCCSVPWST